MKRLNDIQFASLAKEAHKLLDRANQLILEARAAHYESEKQVKKKAA